MRVLISFPKANSYVNKDVNTQRIYRDLYKKYLTMLLDTGCSIEYIHEDELAKIILSELDIKADKVYTTLGNDDVQFAKTLPDKFTYSDYMLDERSHVEEIKVPTGKFVVPMSVLREGKEIYVAKRVDNILRRERYALDEMLSNHRAVIQFRVDNNTDRGISLKDTIHLGDGRLCVEIHINSNVIASYYGGVYLSEDMIPGILTL